MNTRFSSNLFLLIGLNLLIKPLYIFGVEVGIQNAVGTEEYGLYYAMFNFTFMFNVLLDLGINNLQKVRVARNTHEGIAQMAFIIPLKLALTVVYMLVTVTIALAMGFSERYWFFIGWLMLNHSLSAYLLLLRANLSGMHRFVRDSILSITDRLLLIVLCGYVLWISNDAIKIEWFAQFQTIAYITAIALAHFMLPAGYRFRWPIFQKKPIHTLLRQCAPFAVLILLMTIYNRIDGVMIERMSSNGLREAGIYAQAYRLLDAGNNFAFLYAGLLLPMLSRMLGQNDINAVSDLVNQAARLLINPAVLVFVFCVFSAPWIMNTLYSEHAAVSARILPLLMGSFIFMSIGYVFGTLLTATQNLKHMNLSAAAAVLINIVFNLLLIPDFGAMGAAIASCSSLGAMALLQLWIAMRTVSSINLKWLPAAMMLMVTGLLCGTAIQLFNIPESHGVPILACCLLLLWVCFGLNLGDLRGIFLFGNNNSEHNS